MAVTAEKRKPVLIVVVSIIFIGLMNQIDTPSSTWSLCATVVRMHE